MQKLFELIKLCDRHAVIEYLQTNDVKDEVYQGETALTYSLKNDIIQATFDVLLEYGKFDTNKENEEGKTPLQIAIKEDAALAIKELAKYPTKVTKDEILECVKSDKLDCLKEIHDAGIDITNPEIEILHKAVSYESKNCIKYLLENHVDVNLVSEKKIIMEILKMN